MAKIWQDVRYGIRMLLKARGFTAVAVFTLALGIGTCTAIFTIVNAVIFEPLYYPQADRLVEIRELQQRGSKAPTPVSVSYPDFFDWRTQNHVFESISSYTPKSFTLTGVRESQRLAGMVCSADLLSVLGVSPTLGRGFRPEDEKPGTHVAVLSYTLWESTFNSDRNIVGNSIRLDNQSYTVIGVMPPDFTFPVASRSFSLWATLAGSAESHGDGPPLTSQRGAGVLRVIARLRPNVSLAQAQAEMNLIAKNLAIQYPATNARRAGTLLISEMEVLIGNVRPALLMLFAAVGCVLLIACANVANLLLGMATGRHREISVRIALGASRKRIVSQLLTESIVLSFIGSAAGMFMAWALLHFFLQFVPPNIPRVDHAHLDAYATAFVVILAFVTGIVFGLVPALQTARADSVDMLKTVGAAMSTSRRQEHLRKVFVVAETAIGLVLLVAAGLLLRSFHRLWNVDLGFNTKDVLTLKINLPATKYNDEKQVLFYRQLLTDIRTLPGVVSASGASSVPFTGSFTTVSFEQEGHPLPPAERPEANIEIITPDYFRSLEVGFVTGRDFTERDDDKQPLVMIINQAFAQRFFPHDNPIGRHASPGLSKEEIPPMREIIGVVRNMKDQRLDADARPTIYVPFNQLPDAITLLIKGGGDVSLLAASVRRRVANIDVELPVYNVQTLEEFATFATAQPRFFAYLLGLFAVLALLLTAVGLYGVITYSVAQRTQEIGLRMAVGATRVQVLRMVLGTGLRLTGIGVVIGIAGAVGATRLISNMLFGVNPLDVPTFVVVVVILWIVALVASFIPAHRATKVDPIIALRNS